MKKLVFQIIFLLAAIGGCFFVGGIRPGVNNIQAQSLGGFVVEDYKSEIFVQEDGCFLVKEQIQANFFEKRHGIYRTIPYKYKDDRGFSHNFRLEVLAVEDERGNPWWFEESRGGGKLSLKIGTPNTVSDGIKTYIISYKVQRGWRFFEDRSELYWNAVGNDWEEAIKSADITINLPGQIELHKEDLVCYTGQFGSREQNCRGEIVSGNLIRFESLESLGAGSGMSVAVKFPLGYIQEPTTGQRLGYFLSDNWGFFIPIVIFFGMLWLFFKYGREYKSDRTVIVQYEPYQDLTPGEIGFILEERYKNDFVSADIVNLAVKGYLKIRELPKEGLFSKLDYELESIKDWNGAGNLAGHEVEILKGLFSAVDSKKKVSELKDFHGNVEKAKREANKKIKEMGVFYQKIANIKFLYIISGFFVMVFLFMLGGSLQRTDIIVAAPVSFLILVLFGIFMSKRTAKGNEALLHIKGFEQYIGTAERYRVQFQEQENLFEKFLPYAMVFGLADKWAKAFEGIIKKPPSWYESSDPNFHFAPAVFASSIGGFSDKTSAVSAPPSSSSSGFSGGSSGGGGGGGGGGSW